MFIYILLVCIVQWAFDYCNKLIGGVLGEAHSGASTPSLSPRKELNGSSSGCGGSGGSGAASSGGSSSASAAASLHGDDDTDTQHLLDLLSATKKPHVCTLSSLHY